MIIDTKLTILKSYLSEGRLTNGGIKTTIDQTAVSTSEQNNVDLELDSSSQDSSDPYKKKQSEQKDSKEETEDKTKNVIPSDSELKNKNLKLLNLL